MSFPRPNCPRCHGGGDIETVHRDGDGTIVAYIYDRCPCTYRAAWVDQEDWTERSNGSQASNLPGDL